MPSWRSATIARGRVAALDVAAAKAHPGVVEVMTPANRPPIWRRPRSHDHPFNFQIRGAAERSRALRQPADRRRDRRDAGGGDGRARALLAPRYEAEARAHRPRRRGELHAARWSAPASRPRRKRATSRPASPTRRGRSTRPTRRPSQYHNAMEPHAIVAAFEGDRLVDRHADPGRWRSGASGSRRFSD